MAVAPMTTSPHSPDRYARVAVARPVHGEFTYLLPEGLEAPPAVGAKLKVPFGAIEATGFYLGVADPPDQELEEKLKPIAAVLETTPALTPALLELARFAANHYHFPLGEALATALPASLELPKQPRKRAPKSADFALQELSTPPTLTEEQVSVLEKLVPALEARVFQPFLLQGVTGSGKTEVYLNLAQRALAQNRTALVLVPEIALTPQLAGKFRERFGDVLAVLHSGLKPVERRDYWWKLHRGEARIALGARSAIWAPLSTLGLIVVDEEHDGSFKQESGLRYHARDLALVRGKHEGALVVLGSATPSLESLENVRRGRFQHVCLTKRIDDRPLPTIEVVDLRVTRPRVARNQEPPILSAAALTALGETLSQKQQSILFLNRRGHATLILCEVCGRTSICPDCDVPLTFHKSKGVLSCHYCGHRELLPEKCEECGSELLKLGLGTERIEAEVREAFPEARIARLDRDVVQTAASVSDILGRVGRREVDILIGTQMVAKGHDFPGVTLVCVVLADIGLGIPDFRAGERVFQTLTQVAGRAGRGAHPGRVLVQTYNPDAAPIRAMLASDFAGYASLERERRRALMWPPFSRLAAILVDGKSPQAVRAAAQQLATAAIETLGRPETAGLRILGPTPAPFSRLQGLTRWQLIAKAPGYQALRVVLERLQAVTIPGVRVAVDIDPDDLL